MKNESALINQSQIIAVIDKMLHYVDYRLVNHGERVAFIALRIWKQAKTSVELEHAKVLIMSILHDIGAYKTEEIDEMEVFDGGPVWSHAIYGYLFLKYMSPLGSEVEAVLYHHLNYKDYDKTNGNYLDYAALIYLADRVDTLIAHSQDGCDFTCILKNSGTRFDPKYVKLLFEAGTEEIVRKIHDGSYHEEISKEIEKMKLSKKQAFEYLKMMTYSVDFRSEYTVTHTINTIAISLELGKRLKISTTEQAELYLGALLHDVGKVAIPADILEFQGKLTPDKMNIMKQHVVLTHEIIEGLVDEEVCRIASRHHEKLDGTGYPEGLTDADLTVLEKIIAVADIVSALTGKRSYKNPFPKEKTIAILSQMEANGQLYKPACDIMIRNFDEIMRMTDVNRDPVIAVYEEMHMQYHLLNKKVHDLLEMDNRL
ncbi:MAG: HD domain-containing protein [Christensenella sp.]|nr:HD domain-containing protein [Christensenella sp.]